MKVVVFIVSAFSLVMPLWAQQQVVADLPGSTWSIYARGHVRLRRWTQRICVQRQHGPAAESRHAEGRYQTALVEGVDRGGTENSRVSHNESLAVVGHGLFGGGSRQERILGIEDILQGAAPEQRLR